MNKETQREAAYCVSRDKQWTPEEAEAGRKERNQIRLEP